MKPTEIKPNVYYVGSFDPNRKFFDQLIPLPDGTSYNSYLIKGSEKTALIDTVYPPMEAELVGKLNFLNITKLDYIVANHGEQDHSGSIVKLLELYPEAKVVTNAKCKEILTDLYFISDEKFLIINDNEELSLGDKTLQFIMAPWVHWPDTMFTYLKEDKVLFTCDFFGSHLSDEKLYIHDIDEIYAAAKRYYAEIMMPFAKIFRKYFDKIEALNPEWIAPSHGHIYTNPKFIIDAYRDWASDNSKNEVVVIKISMYGNSDKMAAHVIKNLEDAGITVKCHDGLTADVGEVAMDLVDASGIIISTPTVLSGPHPNVVGLVYLANLLKPTKLKYVSILGSLGWGGMTPQILQNLLSNARGAEFIEPVLVKGQPKTEDYAKLDELSQKIIEKQKSL